MGCRFEMQITIPYEPHQRQQEVHEDPARFKVIAAGRGSGKTVALVNEMIRQGLTHPQKDAVEPQRSWLIAETYKQAESIAWRLLFQFLPQELIARKNVNKLQVELVNGHMLEFKGAEDPDSLRGARLVWAGLDEYGQMREDTWFSVIRPMLIRGGGAMFIGTPGADGSPHFHDLWNKGQRGEDGFKSWLFYTDENPHIPREEIEKAKRELPADIYDREFRASFSSTSGLIYDNFKHPTHVIPMYEPTHDDLIVGSIDPGLHNPTGALLSAWDKDGVCRVFKEYYVEGKLAEENAKAIKAWSSPHKVAYWVIDRSSIRRDPTNGLSVYNKYLGTSMEPLCRPLITAPNDPGSVWSGIDEVKKLFHINPTTGTPKMQISVHNHFTLWELSRYTRYKHKWHVEKNEEERPRKLHDHLMDALRNMVMTRPWLRRNVQMVVSRNTGY